MAASWLQVARQIEAMPQSGTERPAATAFKGFSDPAGPVIETTHRLVPPDSGLPAPTEPAPGENRFRENGRLIKTAGGESFLAEGKKGSGWS